MTPVKAPLLQAQGISKAYPGVIALDKVSMHLSKGEILAIIGENGAGKSTLMKSLAGLVTPDAGGLLIDGVPTELTGVQHAMSLGISLIHQELNLADNLDIAQNIYLGREPKRLGLINRKAMLRGAKAVLDEVGLDLPPTTPVAELSTGRQQMVEIAKAISTNARVIIMDEPTASLSDKETQRLYDVVDRLSAKGVGIIFISHRLEEVKRLAHRVTVLRDGQNAGELSRDEVDHDAMVKLMVGRDASNLYQYKPRPIGDAVLKVDGLATQAFPEHRLSLEVKAGEIVGVAGLVGAGRTEMLRALFGIDPPLAGTIHIAGNAIAIRNPKQAIAAGLALVPEDRKAQGVVLSMSIRENTSMARLGQDATAGIINARKERELGVSMKDKLATKAPTIEQLAGNLSGGNQQKVVLAKWLANEPKVLLLDEPTRGVDIGAKAEIYRIMEELAHEGVAILFVSSDLEEVLGVADRVLVMHEGKMTGELGRAGLSAESVMAMATNTHQTQTA
ncbi:MAG: sugar ABC transporter ATP-binding protein [Phycisphaeraceae bacterium]|nr:sugar ABC transporter ATP-binding protein [Phycisphaeraceae bacterium]